MKLMKLLGCMLMVLVASAAEPTISVTATPRYPWNGKVDVKFTITGDAGVKYDTSFTAKDVVGGTNLTMKTIFKANGTAVNPAKESLLPGTYNWVWHAPTDLGSDTVLERVTVTAETVVSTFTYSVKFNANGGTGTMANESFTYGTAKALTANAFKRTGYTFQGWATSASGAKAYSDKQSVNNLTTAAGATVNLYAVWEKDLGGVQLWENGPYWAECNVGATKPEGYGYYFQWGDAVGYKRNSSNSGWVSAKDGKSLNIVSGNCYTYTKSASQLKSAGYTDSSGNLVAKYDAATSYLGAPWRMPTYSEFDVLITKCTTTWTTRNGVYGILVKGKGDYSSKSIFLPAAGYGRDYEFLYPGSYAYYWSSTPYSDSTTAWYLYFYSNKCIMSYGYYRYYALSVRPLRGIAK